MEDYNIYQRLGLLTETYSEHEIMQEIFLATDNATQLLDMLVSEEQHGVDVEERCYGDPIEWYLEASTVVDAVDWLLEQNIDADGIIDYLLEKYGLTADEETFDGFTGYEDYCRWRNGA